MTNNSRCNNNKPTEGSVWTPSCSKNQKLVFEMQLQHCPCVCVYLEQDVRAHGLAMSDDGFLVLSLPIPAV